MLFRIGHGYDVHALAEGLPLVLGGVGIEHDKGCVAHSDGDVVIHALCDALLGAAALMGLGYGTYMSCSQAIIIGLAPRGRMGLATSTFFVFMDLSVGAGPLVLGALLPYAGFRAMYAALAVLLACCAGLYYVLYGQNAAKQKLAR